MRLGRAFAILAAAALAGCATSAAFRAGEKADRMHDYDRAVLEYSKAVKEHPDNVQYRRSLEAARIRASAEHTTAARRLAGRGLYKEAMDEYRLALDLNPASTTLPSEIREVEAQREAGARSLALDEIKERAREKSLPGLSLGPAAREPLGLAFRGANLREAYQALGKAVGVNFVFDPQFQDAPISLDLRNVPFDQAMNALSSVGRTFYRVVDAQVVSVIPDTPAKRREYEQQVVKTLFLSNADLKETIDLLRIVLGARRVAPLQGANALTISDTPDKVAAAERIVEIVDKRKAEVMVEVEILEVDRNRLKDWGIQITSGQPGYEGVVGGIFPDPTKTYTLDSNPYSSSNLVVTRAPRRHLPPAPDGRHDAPPRQPPDPLQRGSDRAGALRRPGPRARHHLQRHRHGRPPPAAHHVLRVQERGREHRHHAASAPRRGGVPPPEARHLLRRPSRLPGPAHLQQPHRDLDHPPQGRRDEHPRRAHQRSRAHEHDRPPRAREHPAARPDLRAQPEGGAGDGHRDDAHPPRRAPDRDP